MNEPVAALSMRKAITARSGVRVREAVAEMRRTQIGCVFVLDDHGRPIGKFTERLLVRLLASDPAGLDDRIENHMIEVNGCVSSNEPIARVLECMQQAKLRFVCVTDHEGKVLGLTGQKSLMEYIAEHFARPVKAQMMDSKLHMDHREGA